MKKRRKETKKKRRKKESKKEIRKKERKKERKKKCDGPKCDGECVQVPNSKRNDEVA